MGFERGHKNFITKEGLERIRQSLIGRICSKETREKIRKSLLSHKVSKETREKISLKKNGVLNLKNKGPNNGMWKGDMVTYSSLHYWIRYNFGTPNKCEKCGKDNLIGRKIHWANISGEYKRDRADWLRLCAKCHKCFDISRAHVQ